MRASSVSTRALELLGDRAQGSVQSVFATSLNVELARGLVHVGSADAPLSCMGVAVAAGEAPSLAARVDAGDVALWDGRSLAIRTRSGVVTVDVEGAAVVDLSVRPLAGELDPAVAGALLGDAAALDLEAKTGLPLEGEPRSEAALGSLAALSAACQAHALGAAGADLPETLAGAVDDAVAYLVGRGPGLTPSGDDVLMGFGTALRFLWGSQGPAAEFFEAVARAYPGRTTPVSEAYLAAMVAGQANEDYLDLVEALRAGDGSALPALLDRTLSVGHTSGADGLLGFMAAFGCLA